MGELLNIITKNTDPALLHDMGRLRVDRRLRTNDDLQKAEKDTKVGAQFLVDLGCEKATAHRLIKRCANWGSQISTISSPSHRLMVLIAKQMSRIAHQAERLQERTGSQVERASATIDRLDLKHAKCVSLAKRIRKSQDLPPGWISHRDESGKRYLQHIDTGLTSWTLP